MDIQRLYLALDNGRRSGSWLDKSRDTLRSFWNWAVDLELAAGNPITRASWPRLGLRKRSSRSRVLTEISAELLDRILDIVPIRQHRVLVFMFLLGLRISEALAARWSWICRDPRAEDLWILVVPDTIKQRIGYSVPLGSRVLRLLGPRGGDGDRLFPEAPGTSAFRHALQRAGGKLGVHLSPHQFRRSCATGLIQAGMPLPEVQAVMGWRSPPKDFLDMLRDSYYFRLAASKTREYQDKLRP